MLPPLTAHGFSLAGIPDDDDPRPGTLTVVVPEDPTIFPTSRYLAGTPGRADRFLTAASLINSPPSVGTGELANRLRSDLLFRADTSWDLRWDLPD